MLALVCQHFMFIKCSSFISRSLSLTLRRLRCMQCTCLSLGTICLYLHAAREIDKPGDQLFLQPSVLLRQILAAPLQNLAVYFCLLQLCSAKATKSNQENTLMAAKSQPRNNYFVCICFSFEMNSYRTLLFCSQTRLQPARVASSTPWPRHSSVSASIPIENRIIT